MLSWLPVATHVPGAYAIAFRAREVELDNIAHTQGAMQLEAGNLYRSMRRLEADGLVEEAGRRPAADADDERRRYFRLSAFGRRVLAAEMLRLRALVQLAEDLELIGPVRA